MAPAMPRGSAWSGAAWGLVVALLAILAITAFSLGGGGFRAVAVAVGVPLGVLLGSLPGVRVATRAIVEFLEGVA